MREYSTSQDYSRSEQLGAILLVGAFVFFSLVSFIPEIAIPVVSVIILFYAIFGPLGGVMFVLAKRGYQITFITGFILAVGSIIAVMTLDYFVLSTWHDLSPGDTALLMTPSFILPCIASAVFLWGFASSSLDGILILGLLASPYGISVIEYAMFDGAIDAGVVVISPFVFAIGASFGVLLYLLGDAIKRAGGPISTPPS